MIILKKYIKSGQRHICPINTRVINNHIYKHIYVPQYSCCEEDVVTNCECGMDNNMTYYDNYN